MALQPIATSKFYDEELKKYESTSLERAAKNALRFKDLVVERMPQRLLGPTQFWKQYFKQADALEAARIQSEKETVCTFVYQNEDGFRHFVVAHPEVYWWYSSRMPSEKRSSYEVIPEGAPCRLYFDLEFNPNLNPERNGPRMTATLIKIFCLYIEKYWGHVWDEKEVVNLDSTTSSKFSRHLIFCKKDIAFVNNFDAGRLVKGVCREIEEYLEHSTVLHDVLSQFDRQELEELFVQTDKGKKIFIDTAVYTRNRHFRTYQSTKQGKLAHLKTASDSKYVLPELSNDKDLTIFLNSLISYFPDKKKLEILEIKDDESIACQSYAKYPKQANWSINYDVAPPLPELDKFILSLVKPGKIRLRKQIAHHKICFEIIGNRYCANIGRQHKSNHVYWIADLQTKKVYQKCHDEDCANFTSAMIDIPLEILFQLDNEDDQLFFDAT